MPMSHKIPVAEVLKMAASAGYADAKQPSSVSAKLARPGYEFCRLRNWVPSGVLAMLDQAGRAFRAIFRPYGDNPQEANVNWRHANP